MSPGCSEIGRPFGVHRHEQLVRGVGPGAPVRTPGSAQGSAEAVNDGLTRYRLSVLVFDEAAGLWRALAELLRNGISPEQFCLIASPDTLASLDPRAAADEIGETGRDALSHLVAGERFALHVDGHDDLAAHCGVEMSSLFRRMGSIADDFAWMRNELGKKLAVHADQGAINLLVSAAGAEQHSLIARVLLRHGRHDLQTHVFSWPSPL